MTERTEDKFFEELSESQWAFGFLRRYPKLDADQERARLALQELNQTFLYASLKVAITMETARQIFESKMECEEAVEADWNSIAKAYPIRVQKVIDLMANQLAESLTQSRPREIFSWALFKLKPNLIKIRKGIKAPDLVSTLLSSLRIVATLTQSLISRESHAQFLERGTRGSIDGISKTFIENISKIQKPKEKIYDPLE